MTDWLAEYRVWIAELLRQRSQLVDDVLAGGKNGDVLEYLRGALDGWAEPPPRYHAAVINLLDATVAWYQEPTEVTSAAMLEAERVVWALSWPAVACPLVG